MKPLVPALLTLLLCSAVPLRAQVATEPSDSLKDLKKKYAKGGQKPEAPKGSPAAESGAPAPAPIGGAPAPAPSPADSGLSIGELEMLLLRSPDCKKNPDDTAQMARELKGKYAIVSCHSEIDGFSQIVLVPKSASVPGQQLRYASVRDAKLLRARIVDHYLVLQFSSQVQYLDLLKEDQGTLALSGYVAQDALSRFEDIVIFKDALKNYGGVAESSEMLAGLDEGVARAVGSKRHGLEASKIRGEWVVVAKSQGNFFQIWPKAKP
ncbi:MAG: hypothetical protein HYX59_12305 [Elusimicrobia bacterium]|nr:hypothetical protein [Elusimicrobiota bacterium]